MPWYAYTALDQQNAYAKSRLEARTSKAAAAVLEKQGLLVINLKREENLRWSRWNAVLNGVSAQDKIFVTRNVETMLEAGISIDQALSTTAEQVSNPAFRAALHDIAGQLRSGQSFHRALAAYPKYFSTFYTSMVRVGESSGKLDGALRHLLLQQEQDLALKTKARSAMIYPAVIFCALLFMVTLMLTFVIPKVAGILGSYHVQLPLATRILLWLSHGLTNYYWAIFPGLFLIIFGLVRYYRTPRGRWQWDGFFLRVPKIGEIVREYNLALFTRSLSSLLQSGVGLDQALKLSGQVTPNSRYAATVAQAISFVQKGVQLHDVMRGHERLYTPLSIRMVEVGEKTGKLTHMLDRLAIFYESNVQTSLQNLSAVVEPILLLTIGVSVGFVAIAVITPIWKFSATI